MAQLYVTLSALQARLAQDNAATATTWTAAQAALQASICTDVNESIETFTGRAIGSDSNTTYTLDGYDALEDRRCMVLNGGVRTVTLLEIAPYTGASFTTVTSGDYFILPTATNRQPGWPGTEVWMTNIPSGTTTYPYYPPGFANVRITGTFGWAAMPNEIREVAEIEAVRRWNSRRFGEGDTGGASETGEPIISHWLPLEHKRTLDRYKWRPVFIV